MSFLEIYNEELRDLLDAHEKPKPMTLREGPNGSIQVLVDDDDDYICFSTHSCRG